MKLARWAVSDQEFEGRYEHEELITTGGRRFDAREVVWLPPSTPTKVIGIALNFADHAAELGLSKPDLPAIFLKPQTSLIGHNGTVLMPPGSQYMHYEVELVAIIGQRCRNVKAERALDVVRGYTIGNDVTVRDHVGNYFRPPLIGKGWDTFGPCGPWMVTADEFGDPSSVDMRTLVNGELRQQGNTRDWIYSLSEMIEYASMIMTLNPGDQIWTGTPQGLSHVFPGDVMRMEIDGMGALENPIALGPEPVCTMHLQPAHAKSNS
jgi:5-oxopent-3-ene-1,2,5-tricarboxylate decarboxylase/2-hydroxyhepta-2,4-diene-1,7-dioate isomerase